MKILIIEDEILIQRSLKKLLEARGAEVTATSTGVDGIELIRNKSFDRIICDLMLQDITGFDIIEESKSKLSGIEIANTFVIITAYSSEQVMEKATSYGCPVINKPFIDLNETLDIFLAKETI